MYFVKFKYRLMEQCLVLYGTKNNIDRLFSVLVTTFGSYFVVERKLYNIGSIRTCCICLLKNN